MTVRNAADDRLGDDRSNPRARETGRSGDTIDNRAGHNRISRSSVTEYTQMQIGPRALLYLAALTLSEIVTVLVDTRWGVVGHAVILAFVVTQAGINAFQAGEDTDAPHRSSQRLRANFLITLALVPLIRIVSIAMPLTEFPEWSWYGLIAIPLLAAAWSAAGACGYSRRDLGLWLDWSPLAIAVTLLIGLSGIGLGYIEYRILLPDPLISNLTPARVILVSVTLFIGTGFTEEVIFRGLLQVAGGELFGYLSGIIYASALFSMLHIGHRSLVNVGYVFLVALAFGTIARHTRSIVGVTIAHGLTNICLFVVFPYLMQSS